MLKDQEAEDQKLLQLHEFDGKGDRGSWDTAAVNRFNIRISRISVSGFKEFYCILFIFIYLFIYIQIDPEVLENPTV